MECVKGALKSSLRPETAVKTTHSAFLDDLCANSAQIGFSVDDSFVDGFLDFSDGGIEEGLFEEAEGEVQRGNVKACSDSVFLLQQQTVKDNTSYPGRAATFSVKDDFGSAHGSELSLPADDLADLEWLSHFVEDSPAEYPLTLPGGSAPEKLAGNGSEPETQVSANPCFSIPVQTKARSKRARTGGRVWSLGPPPLTESSPSSSASSSSTSSLSPLPSKAWLIYAGLNQTAESFIGKPPHAKTPKRKQATEISGSTAQQPRRCSHCLVQKTPQWRAGPHGAKTLCNACGVRYKSGRLFPEYRPACSPTFSSNFHSNNHRKVLELRRKKESDSGLAPPVRSF